jgi:hypothetical protein
MGKRRHIIRRIETHFYVRTPFQQNERLERLHHLELTTFDGDRNTREGHFDQVPMAKLSRAKHPISRKVVSDMLGHEGYIYTN